MASLKLIALVFGIWNILLMNSFLYLIIHVTFNIFKSWKDEMGRACSTLGGDERCTQNLGWKA
jgi:hypothetical protein